MCYYSVSARARKASTGEEDPAQVGEELTLARFPADEHKGFASLEDLKVPVCVLPNTCLRYIGLDQQLAQMHNVPTEGKAKFVSWAVSGWESKDLLEFAHGRRIPLADLNVGLQITIASVPIEVPVRAAEPVAFLAQ